MTTVSTIRGPVALDSLGVTLMHEHVFAFTTPQDIKENYDQDWDDEEGRVADAIEKLRAVKAAGVDTIVDPTVIGLGRYIPRVQRVNEAVDINIIVATGIYTFDLLPHYFHYRGPGTMLGGPELLTDMFVSDIRKGIGGTGVKAAFLKCVLEETGFTPDLTRLHGAICETQQETGVPIMVHTNGAHQTGRQVLEFYAKRGIDFTRVQIAHAGDSNDLDYLKWIMDQGATIGCDRFGMDMINTTADRVRTIVSLCAEGYADRIVLSHDTACYIDFFCGHAAQAKLHEVAPNWNFLHISKEVLPALREQGVTDDQIKTMMIDNPQRYFAVTG